MTNILNVGTSALLSYQKAIQVTGHNITNVETPGYSRSAVHFDSRKGDFIGGNYIGNGVEISSVERINEPLYSLRLRDMNSLTKAYEVFCDNIGNLDNYLSLEDSSLSNNLQTFFSALHNATDTPNFMPAREAFLSETNILVDKFHQINDQLNYQIDLINAEIDNTARSINTIVSQIAEVNKGLSLNAVDNNDLLNQRDRLLNDLSDLIDVSVTTSEDGSVVVSIGSGQPLLAGTQRMEISAIGNTSDPRNREIQITSNSTNIPITNIINGGKLGGLLNFRDDIIKPTQNTISLIALGFSDNLNQQHQLGMDLSNNIGGSLFSDINTAYLMSHRSSPNNSNVGNAVFGVAITDTNQLSISDYKLSVGAGPSYQLKRLSDDSIFTIPAFPYTVDGFSINLTSGAGSPGDSFIISPTYEAANYIELNIHDANKLAFASPVRGSSSLNNTGHATLSQGLVVDTTNTAFTTTSQQLSPPIRIEFLSDTTYQLVNETTSAVIEGPLVYNPATDNEIFPTAGAYDPGYRFSLSGDARTGDMFNITYNTDGYFDNRNAILMADQQSQKLLHNGTSSYQLQFGGMLSAVGTQHQEAKINFNASNILRDQAQSRIDNLSGVNLDEELANLLQFQQGYQAASHIISIANNMFDTLIGIFR